MYQVKSDRLVTMESPPAPNAGAPLPTVVSDRSRLLIAYIISQPDPGWDGAQPTAITSTTPEQPIAIVSFQRPYAHSFGPPNDEALDGHPLSVRGLKPYSWFEVLSSSWIQSLLEMNSVHPRHRPDSFKAYRHFIATFHDSTFECVAHGFDVRTHLGSLRSAVDLMAGVLRSGAA